MALLYAFLIAAVPRGEAKKSVIMFIACVLLMVVVENYYLSFSCCRRDVVGYGGVAVMVVLW